MESNLYHPSSAAPATAGPYNFRSRDNIPIPKRLLSTPNEYAPVNLTAVPCSSYDVSGKYQPFSSDLRVNYPGCSHWPGSTRPKDVPNVSSDSFIIDMRAADHFEPRQEGPFTNLETNFPKLAKQPISSHGNGIPGSDGAAPAQSKSA